MNTPIRCALFATLALCLVSCAVPTPEQARAKDENRRQTNLQWDAEHKQAAEADFQFYLEDYAHRLGKARSELTDAEKEEARHDWETDYDHGWIHNW